MEEHINLYSTCPYFYDISDHHKPIILSCKKNSSDGFIKPKKVFKWSKHLCNTKSSNIYSNNYFSVLENELSANGTYMSADDMVQKFFDTSTAIGKDLKTLIPIEQKGPPFHCPFYIKRLSHEKYLAYKNIKPLSNCDNIESYLNQFSIYENICRLIKGIKSRLQSNIYKANIFSIGKLFVEKKNYRTARIQSLLHRGMLWCIGSYSNDKNKHNDVARNTYLSMYALSRDLCIPPLAGISIRKVIGVFCSVYVGFSGISY